MLKTLKKIKFTKLFTYLCLIVFSFTFLNPLLLSLAHSFKSLQDLSNPSVFWIPLEPTLKNYQDILQSLDLIRVLTFTTFYAATCAILQTFSCAFIGYGFARYDFKLKKFLLLLVVIVFLIPPQTIMTPSYVLLGKLNLTNSLLAFFLPAVLGQGLKSSIFILIFYSFFKAIPNDIFEAANLEGAKPWQVFLKIVLPLVKGAVIITFVLSFVWYWNETYFSDMYYQNLQTYPLEINRTITSLLNQDPAKATEVPIYDGIKAAGVILLVIPLVIFYSIFQRQFRQSVDNSGLTGQ